MINKNSKFQTPNSNQNWHFGFGHWEFKRSANGQVMIIALVFLVVVLIIASSLFTRVADFIRFGSNSVMKEQATNLAEAGIDYATQRLNDLAGAYPDADGAGTDTQTLSIGQVVISVENKSQNLRTITSTGYIPNATSPRAKRTIKVDVLIDTQSVSFRYAIQMGNGGLSIANSAIIHGSVYSNGSINGSGSSTIEGDAYAVGTISSPDPFVTGTKFAPASPQPLPSVDYQLWKDAANINNDPITCTPKCTISNSATIGPKKYIGDLEITNNVLVTLNGPVHVTGNFSMTQGGTTLKLSYNFGSNGTVLIVDGTVSLTQGGNFQPTNASPKGYILVISTSTSSEAIKIAQSGATAVFYALEGGAELSQTANVNSMAAKSVSMTQTSQLTYDSGLASALFTSGPGGSWQIKKGTYKFTSSP